MKVPVQRTEKLLRCEAGDGDDLVPVEVDAAVGAGEDGGAAEIGELKYSPVRPLPVPVAGWRAVCSMGMARPSTRRGALCVGDCVRRRSVFRCRRAGRRGWRRTVVVALQGLDELCVGPMTAMLADAGLEGKDVVLVFEEDHGFACGLEGEGAVLGGVVFGEGDAAVGEAGGRIEHAETEAGAEEAMEGGVDLGFGDEVLMDGFDESGEGLALAEAALEVGAGFDGGGGGVGHVGCVVVAGVDVGDGGAVADDVAVEVPGVAEVIAEEHGVGAGGRSVDGVVGAHDGLRVGFGDGGAEGGEVGVFKIVRGDVDVEAVAEEFGAAVDGEVLGRGDDA